MFRSLDLAILRARHRLLNFAEDLSEDDRGDVPGWVLITLMTAALVVAIWALAGPALSTLFNEAIGKVQGM